MTDEKTGDPSPPLHLFAALAAAKADFKPLKKSGKNPHLKNAYSTLKDMLEACGPALTKHGLHLIQVGALGADGKPWLVTKLVGTDDEIESWFQLDSKPGDAQALGSWITYCRRYALAALLGLEGDWDDDGEAAVGRAGAYKGRVALDGKTPEPLPPVAPPINAKAVNMVAAFEKLGVTDAMLSDFLGGRDPRKVEDFEMQLLAEIYNDMTKEKLTWEQASKGLPASPDTEESK